MSDQERAREARIKLDAARIHLGDAIEALSGPVPDWVRAQACADMTWDIAPALRRDARQAD